MPCGSTTTAYVPLTGRTFVSTKPPVVPNRVPPTRLEPSGFKRLTFDEQQVELPIVTPVSFRLTRWPATPVKVRAAFWPGAVVVTLVGAPKDSDPVTLGGTSYSSRVTEPVSMPCGSTSTE